MINARQMFLNWILVVALFGVLAFFWVQPINLTAVDIGRHIKNGQLILQGETSLLYKNYYSFTYPDYPFINHHWLFGVFSYVVWALSGFNGLSIIYIMVLLAGFFFFYQAARRWAPTPLLFFLTALAICVITDRREIRPEGFSALFLGLYFYLLVLFKDKALNARQLFLILIPSQVLWVNMHIFFFMGPVLTAIFWWDAHLNKDAAAKRVLRNLLIGLVLANVINPSGISGMLTPLNIFKGLGYNLAENQNVFFMIKRFPTQIVNYWYVGLAAVGLMGMVIALKQNFRANLPWVVLAIFTMAAGFKAVRLMPFFALFFIPLCAMCYGPYLKKANKAVQSVLIIAGICLIFIQSHLVEKDSQIGLIPRINGSADFYLINGLKGPIFSNYDIGGYLIFHLAPEEKVFVDNRQEAFPVDFFKKTYIPMQTDPHRWREMEDKHGFNVIYFYRLDLTPWGQQFLVDRIQDPAWAPVFVDDVTIIFLKRNAENAGLIEKFEIPSHYFSVGRG